MLPTKVGTDNRNEYLLLPYNDPIRVAMRALEASLGAMFREENAAKANAGGLLSGALALLGAIAGYLILGPAGVFAGAMTGAGIGMIAGNVIRVRTMYNREWDMATKVFGSSLPPRDQILITDMSGMGGRAFTYPGSSIALLGAILNPVLFAWLIANPSLFRGKTLLNFGSGFRDGTKYTINPYMVQGQAMIHELAHAWQIRYTNSYSYVCTGVSTQASNSLGKNVYAVTPGQQWNTYGLEQQATIVDTWFAQGSRELATDAYYRYIRYNLRPGNPDASSADPQLVAVVSAHDQPITKLPYTPTSLRKFV